MMSYLRKHFRTTIVWFLVALLVAPPGMTAGAAEMQYRFNQEELDQMLAPIALYPDSLLSQVFMASTYPLEVVQASRWAGQNKTLQGDALAKAMEQESWDPSVKSLVQFPDVLAMMSERLDWTQNLGDAFLSQQDDVIATVQNLRLKAQEAGNLKTTTQQIVKVEKQVIVIEPASPTVVYVPYYDPFRVYGTWWWPRYPPYFYYPPYYPRPTLYSYSAGIALGVAWGYAWGYFDWHHRHVKVNVNRNVNLNVNINRNRYVQHYATRDGQWRHNVEHRKGVAYRDRVTAQKFNRASTMEAQRSREAFRGRVEQGRKDLPRVAPTPGRDMARPAPGQKPAPTPGRDMARPAPSQRPAPTPTPDRGAAFSGVDRSGSKTREYSNRGSASRESSMRRQASPAGGGRR